MAGRTFLRFEETRLPGRKTPIVTVYSASSGGRLGQIYFYPRWRQFVFEPSFTTLWSRGCLDEINAKLDELAAARRSA